MQVRA